VFVQCFWRLFGTFKKSNKFLQPSKFVIGHPCLNKWKIMTNYMNFLLSSTRFPFATCWATKAHPWNATYCFSFLTC
jgi:hypothetical protein